MAGKLNEFMVPLRREIEKSARARRPMSVPATTSGGDAVLSSLRRAFRCSAGSTGVPNSPPRGRLMLSTAPVASDVDAGTPPLHPICTLAGGPLQGQAGGVRPCSPEGSGMPPRNGRSTPRSGVPTAASVPRLSTVCTGSYVASCGPTGASCDGNREHRLALPRMAQQIRKPSPGQTRASGLRRNGSRAVPTSPDWNARMEISPVSSRCSRSYAW